jgi:hypothetical protein
MIRPSGGQPPSGLSAAWALATLRAYLVFFSYYQIAMLFLNMVCLTVAPAQSEPDSHVVVVVLQSLRPMAFDDVTIDFTAKMKKVVPGSGDDL